MTTEARWQVWGVDTRSRAWHAVGPGWSEKIVVPDRVPVDEARVRLGDEWHRHVVHASPGSLLVACEEPISLKNGKTNRVLAMAAGAVHVSTFRPWPYGAGDPGVIEWLWVDVESWKRHVCGKGGISKDEVVDFVESRLDLAFEDQDHYDAACIRTYGMLAQEMAALGHKPVDVKTEKKMSLAERASYEAAKQRGLQAAGLG